MSAAVERQFPALHQRLLSRPQRGVGAALFQKRVVRAVLDDIASVKHVNFIRRRDVRQAVRDEQHRLAPGEGVDLGHDVVLTLHVDVRRGLVKDVYRAVVQQRASKGETLALAAGEVLAALGK